MNTLSLFGQVTNANDDGISTVWLFFGILLAIITIIAMWRLFTKAGKPGWASLIPIYNTYIELKIIGRPGWWLLLLLIPIVNIITSIVVALDLAKVFGKSSLFGIFLLWLFAPVGFLIIAFGKAKYLGIPNRT